MWCQRPFHDEIIKTTWTCSSVAGPKHVRNSSNTVPPRLALQSKWPKASANIEERKDVCAFRFRINRNHFPFLSVPLYSLYFPWISVLHSIHVDCWGFLFGWAVGHTLVPLELYKREMCRKPLYNGLYLHILYTWLYVCIIHVIAAFVPRSPARWICKLHIKTKAHSIQTKMTIFHYLTCHYDRCRIALNITSICGLF